MTMTDYKTEIFQLDGHDVTAGDMILVKRSAPHQQDTFIAKVLYANFAADGTLAHITVYGGKGDYGATRTFCPERFEVLTPKVQERHQLAQEKARDKRLSKVAKVARSKK